MSRATRLERQSSIGVLASWLQALLSASRTLDFPGRETRGSGHYLRLGFLLSLQWLGVTWRGSGEGRASQVLHGLETWPWVCVWWWWWWCGCDAKGRKQGIALSLLTLADPDDEDRPAFPLASCSLPILNTEFLCIQLVLWVSRAGALPWGRRMEWPCSVGWSLGLTLCPAPSLGG